MSYGDEGRDKWAYGKVNVPSAVEAALCGLVGGDIEQVMRGRGEDLEYYSE
jgi:hypothetical protein